MLIYIRCSLRNRKQSRRDSAFCFEKCKIILFCTAELEDFSDSSKLNTYSDGFKVIKTIVRLYRTYNPMGFFGVLALVLAMISAIFFVPIFVEYMKTGLVPSFPTLIVCGFVMIAAIQSLFAGMQLQTIIQKNRQDFEMNLQRVFFEKSLQEKEE